jgi:hypothetical protein
VISLAFPFGSNSFYNKENNSSMKTLLNPWTIFGFNNNNMANNMLVEIPSNNKVDVLMIIESIIA